MKAIFEELVQRVQALVAAASQAVTQAGQLKSKLDAALAENVRLTDLLEATNDQLDQARADLAAAQAGALSNDELAAVDTVNSTLAAVTQNLADSNTINAPAN